MKNSLLIFIAIIGLWSCSSNKGVVSLEEQKKVEELVTNKSFEIDSQWAFPRITSTMISLQNTGFLPTNSTAGMIDITGHRNYFIFDKDSVKANLPYYGERQLGSAYNTTNGGGIMFDGVPENLKSEKTKKGNYKFNFNIKGSNNSTETYKVSVLIYKNASAKINVYSSHRLTIEYKGKLRELKKEEEPI